MKKIFQVLNMAVIVLTAASCGGGSSAGDIKLFPVEIGDNYGYINRKGEIVINPQFDEANLFRSGVALIRNGKHYAYINEKGEYLSTKRYKEALNFSEGLAWVVEENGVPTAIDTKGNEKFVLKQAEGVYPYSEGLAAFRTLDGKYGFVDKSGNVKIEPKFSSVEFFSEGLCAVPDGTHKYGFINTKGEFAIAPQFDDFTAGFKNGLAVFHIDDKYGVIDKTGKYVINPQFDYIFQDGNLFLIWKDKKWGWCDKTGKQVINPQFDAVSSFFGGNFASVKSGDKWGYLDKTGKYKINPQFDEAYSFIGNIAPVKTGKQWGFIDKEGKYVINPQFKAIAWNDIYNYLSGNKRSCVTSDYFSAENIAAVFDFTSPERLTAASTYNDVMRIFGLSENNFKKYQEKYIATIREKQIDKKVKYDFYIYGTPYDNYVFNGNRKPTFFFYLIYADTEAHAQSICEQIKEKYKDNPAIQVYVIDKNITVNIFIRSVFEEKEFLEKNGKRSEVKTTESGLQYEILTEGSGAKPKETDKVKVHYTGTLIDGTVFDSSAKSGKPVSFSLDQVIKGWTEGLQLMSKGAKYKFYIPSKLAYGEQRAGEKIPQFATLIFDVELLEINPVDE